jgi:hypothetical protein
MEITARLAVLNMTNAQGAGVRYPSPTGWVLIDMRDERIIHPSQVRLVREASEYVVGSPGDTLGMLRERGFERELHL